MSRSTARKRATWRPAKWTGLLSVLGLLLVGLLTWATIAQSTEMDLPEDEQSLLQLAARPPKLLLVPVIYVCDRLTGFFLAPPQWQFALVATFTPLLYAAIAFGAWTLWRRATHRPETPCERAKGDGDRAPSMPRRDFLLRGGGLTLGALGGGLGVDAVFFAPQRLAVRDYVVPIRDLPADLDGLGIVQISDTHYGPFMPLDYLKRMVQIANALRPDLVLLTGDYAQSTPRSVEPGIGIFADLRAPLGAVAVLGNHDHWEGAPACRDMFRRLGVPMVENSRVFLTAAGLRPCPPKGADALCIAGVGDLWCGDVDPVGALDGVPGAMPRLLLSHNPDVAEMLPGRLRVDLMLSGHTHGGQIRLPVLGTPQVPSRYGQRYAGGLCQGPQCPVLVSRGVGMGGIPVRFQVPPEISRITLRRATG